MRRPERRRLVAPRRAPPPRWCNSRRAPSCHRCSPCSASLSLSLSQPAAKRPRSGPQPSSTSSLRPAPVLLLGPRQCSSRSASASLLRCAAAHAVARCAGAKGLGPHAVRRSASELLFLTSPRAACLCHRFFRKFMREAPLLRPVWLREPENSL